MENESPNHTSQHQVELDEDPYFDAFRPRVELEENATKACNDDNIVFNENDVYPYGSLISESFGANLLEDFGERGGTADSTSTNYFDNVGECISLYEILPAAGGFTGKLELPELKATPSLPQSPKSDAIFDSSENSRASLPVAQHPISSDYDAQIELPENTVENDQQIKESVTMPNDEAIKSPTVIIEVEQDVTPVTPSEVKLNEDLGCIALEPEEELKENADKPPDELLNDDSKQDGDHPHTVPTLAPGDFGERDGSSDFTNFFKEPETAEFCTSYKTTFLQLNSSCKGNLLRLTESCQKNIEIAATDFDCKILISSLKSTVDE